MTQNERLIEILSRYFQIGDSYAYNLTRDKTAFSVGTMSLDDFEEFDEVTVEDIADHLIANGVIVPPCKVGDMVYVIFSQFKNEISKCRVDEFLIQGNGMYAVVDIYYPNYVAKRNASFPIWWFGRFVFPTMEEAEKALAERRKE